MQHIQQVQQVQEEPMQLPLVNFQAMLAEQGVPFYAGLPPPRNNIMDSPLQSYHEAVMDSAPNSPEEEIIMKSGSVNTISLNFMMVGQQDADRKSVV